jgi:polyferredoxin
MVRVNRPWGLIFGLSGALAAALATSAFGLSSTTIWQIGDQLSTPRRALAGLLAATVLVTWLIFSHRLWERRKDREPGFRRLALLYNASTLATLMIGVVMLYLTLFALNLGVAWYLVPEGLLEQTLGHQAGFTTYLGMAWGFSTMGILAGAVGASLESDESVRQVAYGHREAHRLRSLRDTV